MFRNNASGLGMRIGESSIVISLRCWRDRLHVSLLIAESIFISVCVSVRRVYPNVSNREDVSSHPAAMTGPSARSTLGSGSDTTSRRSGMLGAIRLSSTTSVSNNKATSSGGDTRVTSPDRPFLLGIVLVQPRTPSTRGAPGGT